MQLPRIYNIGFMDALNKPSFYEANQRKQKTVKLGGQSIQVETLSFLPHVIFENKRSKLVVEMDKVDSDPKIVFERMIELLDCTGVDWRKATLEELPDLVEAFIVVNQLPPLLAWQLPTKNTAKKKEEVTLESIANYEGMEVTGLAARLCSVFSWSLDDIFYKMTWYAVNCFFQEAMIIEHQRREFEYNLAQVGFKKVGDNYEKVPFPELPWTAKTKLVLPDKIKNIKIPEKYLPSGVVVDLSKWAETGKIQTYTIPTVDDNGQLVVTDTVEDTQTIVEAPTVPAPSQVQRATIEDLTKALNS